MIASYEQLPLGKYEEILKLTKGEEADDLGIIAVLSGKTTDELLDMPLGEYAALRDAAGFLFYEPKANKPAKGYNCGKYILNPVQKIDDITTAQYIDFKEYVKHQGTLVQLLSCFLIPAGKKYGEGYDVEEVQNAISEYLCIQDVLGLIDFFEQRLEKLTLASLTYLAVMASKVENKEKRKAIQKKIREARRAFRRSGDGSLRSILSRSLPVKLGLSYIRNLQQNF